MSTKKRQINIFLKTHIELPDLNNTMCGMEKYIRWDLTKISEGMTIETIQNEPQRKKTWGNNAPRVTELLDSIK